MLRKIVVTYLAVFEAVGRIGFLFLAAPAASAALGSGHALIVGAEAVGGMTALLSIWDIVALRELLLSSPSGCGGDSLEKHWITASLKVIRNGM